MVAVALTIGLVLLLAIVKVVLERTDYQARDQDDWIWAPAVGYQVADIHPNIECPATITPTAARSLGRRRERLMRFGQLLREQRASERRKQPPRTARRRRTAA